MYKITIATIGAAALFAVPVFAQTTNHSTDQGNTKSTSSSSASSSQATMSSAQAQQKIMSDLQNDGFTNIHVIPNSFLVHATNKRNEPVVMIINPDSVFEVTDLPKHPGTSTQSNAGNSSQSNAAQSTTTKQ